jgi:NADPH:quinone reductase-like Zn-dependent oxidoreductase
MTDHMRAVSLRAFGGPEVLEIAEIPRPEPGPGEVLVRISAAGVNPADWKLRAGMLPKFGGPPMTPGLDLPGGSYAEFVPVPEDRLAPVPPGFDHVLAAALPTAGLTSWQPLVRVAAVAPGQKVLVHAAAGGLGHLAVQIAKARGAYVIGTARAGKHAFLRELGADEAVDYAQVDFADAVRNVDVVLDPISGDYGPRSLDTLAPGGMLIDVRGTGPDRRAVREQAKERGLRYVEFGFTPSGADLERVAALVQDGALRIIVEEVLPLRDAAKAHELIESGRATGKIVLTL